MSKVLIVDDSPIDRQLAGKLLEQSTDLTILYAADGKEALEVLATEHPDVVVTDMQMPKMNGLDLVLEVRIKHPLVPVILMTAHGSEDLAIQALKRGAASYVPKRELTIDLLDTVETVLDAAQGKRGRERLMEFLTRTESHFILENDPALIPPLVNYLKENLFRMCGSDDTGLVRVTMALREAVLNAMEHGNLDLDSKLREEDEVSYHRVGQERRQQKPYADRRVHIVARESPREAVYVIRDEGAGFNRSQIPDPTDPANLEKRSGRGLLLIQSFMSEVRHNEKGNEITLIVRPEA